MIDEFVAEQPARDLRLPEVRRCLHQVARQARNLARLGAVAFERRGGELQSLFDTVEACGDACREREIRIGVGARAARLEPRRFRRTRNHAQARGAVVEAPRGFHRRPEAVDQPFVAVDGRREEHLDVLQAMQLPGKIAFEELAHLARRLGVIEQVALAVGQALVDVAAAAWILHAPLRHEARHDAKAVADLLGRGLEQHRTVGGFQRLRIQDRRFVNAGAGLGMQSLDRNTELQQLLHQCPEKRLVLVGADQ